MLFIDYSSEFNTIVLSMLFIKLEALGLNPTLCNWVLDFLMGRPQLVTHASNSIIEFADHTTVVGLITNNDETVYSEEGLVLLGGKPLQITNIMASNGVIHMIDGLLVPPSIVPILPKRCDVTENKIIVGPCVRCSYLYESHCPKGSIELQSHMKDCDYEAFPFNPTLNKGCAKYCNTTIERAECCSGFYGPECKTCTGGFQTPCYGKGTCFDGIHGNGSCHCEEGFKGIACHICSDPNKHGEKCDQGGCLVTLYSALFPIVCTTVDHGP
ncbi:stabilin-1-like [Salvelinus sp. IW2-2015]|uniref:stabilin-1-like n=1 Tax=Salvelinus sp. IW2-2015 TaxID=2691554 RepID=UPI0038D45873